MKDPEVTKLWEYCRDEWAGFKEPMRKKFRALDDYVARLRDENAKLRELLGLVDLYERRGCDECQHKARCDSCDSWTWDMCEVWKRIDQLQRELGIEVVES